jgi:hypothetical protein
MNAIRERLGKRRARRNVFRDIDDLPHEQAAGIMRMLAYNGTGEPDILLALSERALATAPDRWKYAYENWARVYRAGRKVQSRLARRRFSNLWTRISLPPSNQHTTRSN